MAQKKIQDIYPLSPMQQGMLFHSLLEPNSGAYIIQTVYELHGQVDLAAFGKSWQKLVDRHSILRTAFVWDNLAEPLQVVGTAAKISLIEHDWQEIPLLEQQEKLTAFLDELRTTGFNLNKAPLMRLDSIKMPSEAQDKQPQVYQFIWTYHHLLLDGWSVPLLIKELLGYYQSFTQDLPLSFTIAFPYKNYIAWLKQQDREQALSYWQKQLQGFDSPTPMGIPTNIVRRENSNHRYRHVDVQLSAETTYKLEFLAREYQLTLNTLIQAAWAVLLHRYSGDSDLVFGATTSGRPPTLAHSQAIVGLFINTLPIRVKIDSQQSLIDWLKQLQAKQITRQEHEYISLIDIHRVSELPKDTPLFNSIIVFENYPVSSLKQSLDVLDIRNVQTNEQTNYPLTLYAAVNSQLSLKLLYNEQLFSDRAIAKILEQLKTLLQGIASNPEQKVGELDILTELEKEKLLTSNSTATAYPRSCFHQLFEAKVAQIQEKNAVIADDNTLTYSELNEQANQLARYLQLKNVTLGSLVGIYLARDSKLLVSLLAVLKAGAAYVPLDPDYPKERISYIIDRAGISHLVTKQNIKSNTFNSEGNLSVINLKTEREIIQQQSTENLDLIITPQSLAYVIYTSGSTGKPKGVAVQHDSLVNFLYSMKEQPGMTESDRLLAITTISFDIAALELYLPLLVGATVIIAPANIINWDRTLAERIKQHQITIMQATPITWRMLLADNWQGKKLKILSGGEALKPQLAQELLTKGKEVWNLYGPTETTIWSSVCQIQNEQVFLGKAIANTQFYILDSQLRLVPPGAIGELHIAGAGLARGYLNQPDLTAEKFIPNPFMSRGTALKDTASHKAIEEQGSRGETINSQHYLLPITYYPSPITLYPLPFTLYKTGDRVKQLPSGSLEYIGRVDNQIKLRGFRIELGEIEAVLNQHPNVQTSVVITDNERLIAYVTLDSAFSKPPELTKELNQFLTNRLPSYMIPSNYIIFKKLPLTPNGKIDRNALVKLNVTKPSLAKADRKPQSEIERAIAEIWQDVLQVRVGLTDNFFDLGGQSLLMIRVHSQIKEKLNVNISLVDMFRYPTVASLAKYFTINTTGDRSIANEAAIDKDRIDAGKNRLQQRRKKRKVSKESKI